MEYREIQRLYQENEKYIRELDDSTPEYSRLLIETIEWKIPNLMQVVPVNFHPKKVVEVGCFCGHVIGNIRINGSNDFKKYGYDINHHAIVSAKKKYPDIFFYCEDAFNSDERADLIILSDIVEHVEDDLEFLKRCGEISKAILINLPLEKALSNASREYGFSDPSGHLRSYDFKSAKDLFLDAGLSVTSWHKTCVVNSLITKKTDALRKAPEMLPPHRQLKKAMVQKLGSVPGFNAFYYGCNLFAFLVKG